MGEETFNFEPLENNVESMSRRSRNNLNTLVYGPRSRTISEISGLGEKKSFMGTLITRMKPQFLTPESSQNGQ